MTLTNAYPIGLAEAVTAGSSTRWSNAGRPSDRDARPPRRGVRRYWGDLTVIEAAGGLSFTAGTARMALPLTHYTGDQFYFATQGESATGNSGATFAGPADAVTVAAWNVNCLGTFRRTT